MNLLQSLERAHKAIDSGAEFRYFRFQFGRGMSGMHKLTYQDRKGRMWKTYTFSYDSPDGRYSFTLMALSPEHAELMLADLKESARLDGEVSDIIPT